MSPPKTRAILTVRLVAGQIADKAWAMIGPTCGFVVPGIPTLGWRVGDEGLVCVALVAVIVFLATSTRRSARRCPRCKEINREAAIFCAQCGTRLRGK